MLGWEPVGHLLTSLAFMASRHLAALVMRPPGTLDPWSPIVDLMELGVLVVGHMRPTEFFLFAHGVA